MFLRISLFVSVLFFACSTAFSQSNEALINGKVFNKANNQALNDVRIELPALKLVDVTDGSGEFSISHVPYGTHMMIIGGNSAQKDTMTVTVNEPVIEIPAMYVIVNDANASMQTIQIPTIALEESSISSDDDGMKTSFSGVLTASMDPFISSVAYTFGPYRFQARGYDGNQQQVLINGMVMNDVETGDAYWSQWGGLNDVFRGRDNTYGLSPSEYGFGGLNGMTYFDAIAANQRKETRVSYAITNRTYRNRLMLTHNSGIRKSGWAYSFSVSKRWAEEGYVPGTFYDGYSYYAGASKNIKKHQLSLFTFGTPTRRGKSSPVVKELYDLTGDYFYNPNWGYQNGEKRNARIAETFQPMFVLNHQYKPNNNTKLTTSLSYQFGKNSNSTIDWYNGADPRPDYYKKLPSYYNVDYLYNPTAINETKQELMSNPDKLQIDWDRLYSVNYSNFETINDVNGGTGNNIYGRRSVYVVSADVDDMKKWGFNSNFEKGLNEHITLYTGISGTLQQTESYKELQDLLGGDFYVNFNQFAERQYVGNYGIRQNDLLNPNRLVKEGDKYNYDYITHYLNASWWGQAKFQYDKFDFFAAATVGNNSFYREGLYQHGLFPNASLGNSDKQNYLVYGGKGGVTYKLNGRNFLYASGGIGANAPSIENTFISIRTRDYTISNPVTQKHKTVEGGYLLHSPRVNARAVVYATDITDAVVLKRYYSDFYQNFANNILQGVDMRFTGTELAIDYKINSSLNVTGVAAIGQAFYTNRPTSTIYLDNDTLLAAKPNTVYIKDYYISAGPQSAYTAGVHYRSKNYWFANVNFNFFDRNYIDIAPDRRTSDAIDLLSPTSESAKSITSQEKLPTMFSIDMYLSKSFLVSKHLRFLPRSTFLYLSVGVNNLLNNRLITGGFEQLRFDFGNNEPGRFPSKYFYGFGTNYFINASLKF
jgi:hypothetical protein